jgi:4-diphosphocytidyl-2-C-methyl-D-erythritol kinase
MSRDSRPGAGAYAAAPMVAAPVVLSAPAKLTLSLRITGVRDDGYHLIDAEMVTLDLADELALVPIEGPSILRVVAAGGARPIGPPAPGAPSVGAGPDNLVHRALAAVGRHADVTLTKRIPPGAGLGGGSSDAAAILRWAGCDDAAVAAALGADVPFCVRGGRARVRGIGEVVEPLEPEPRTFTLLTPPFGCATPAVYAAWDARGGPAGERGNDLEPAALIVEPRLAGYRDRLGDATGREPRLAGSGSTWFVEGAFPGDDRLVVRTTAPLA